VTGFIDVVLRGLGLGAQAVVIGGVALLGLLEATPDGSSDGRRTRARVLGSVAVAAAVVALVHLGLLGLEVQALAAAGTFSSSAFLATPYLRASTVRVAAGLGVVVLARAARGRGGGSAALVGLAVASTALAISAAWISHAAARLSARALPLTLDAFHQVAAGVWVGGLFHLLTVSRPGGKWPPRLLPRVSTVMLVAVGGLVVAGLGLAGVYVGNFAALVGTSYGLMVMTKVAILSGLLLLGGLNFVAVRRAAPGGGGPPRLHRFVEVELGLGLTALFVAASLTSLPVAADVVADRATLAEVLTRFTPQWPTLTSPALADMPVGDRDAPRTAEDRAWSEYNHHVAGLFVLLMGLLAILHGTGRARWAHHWPLVFLGLAAFLFVRNDPGAWPIGPAGFWESMRYPEVVQHRIFVLLVVVFGLFEWMVRSGRLAGAWPRVFPILCAVGGALLLAHSHASANLKTEFLAEVTHAPLGLLGLVVGWGRWLELRLPAPERGLPARAWSWALALVGVVLLIYRES
jgi:copper resistance protein D